MRGKSLTQEQRMAKLGYVTAAFAAEVLGVSRQTVTNYCVWYRRLQSVKVFGRRFITLASLDKLLAEHVRQQKSAAKTARRAQ